MSLTSLIVDFNSYFASVEQQLEPRLRGRPIAVVPMMAESTCAIAASYEAKAFGVKTGTLVRDARRMCPGIVFLEARHEAYIKMHHELIAAVNTCMHVEEVLSIDEMLCPLTGRYQNREDAVELARKIKAAIYAQVGECLRCSIGIAPNAFLAKTASDMQKPDGLIVIEKHELPQVLFSLKLRDLCGIGEAMEERLHAARIETVEQLCTAPKSVLHAAWGSVQGNRMYEMLQGNPVPHFATQRTTVGHSHVLPPAQRNETDAFAVLQRLLQKAAMRLRDMKYVAASLALTVKYPNRGKWHDNISFNETDDTLDLIHAMQKLWDKRPPKLGSPMFVGVALNQIIPREHATGSLFPEGRNREKLNQVMDKLNQRYGRKSAYFGGAHSALGSGNTRIAFTHVPDLKLEDTERG